MKRSLFQKMKTLFSVVLTMCMLLAVVPITALAESRETNDYIITVQESKYQKVYEKLKSKNILKGKTSQTLIAQMTKTQAFWMQKDKNIISVEEDTALFSLNDDTINNERSEELLELLKDAPSSEKYGWNMKMIRATDQDVELSSDGSIKVAIFDTGISETDELTVTERVNFVSPSYENQNVLFDDPSGHGTGIAGVIASKKDGKGVIGINPNVSLYSVNVLDENNQTSASRVIKAIDWAIENEINIINMSFGTTVNSPALHQAVSKAYDHGLLLVAAAGNQGSDNNGENSNVEYPAAYPEVIAVGAIDGQGKRADFSSTGVEVELMAPGTNIVTNGVFQGYMGTGGTSIAAAHVTAVASLIWGKDSSQTNDFVRDLLISTAKPLGNKQEYGNGLVDAKQAMDQYQIFENTYIPEQHENNSASPDLSELKTYSDEIVLTGNWAGTNHASQIGSQNTTTNMGIMATAANKADAVIGAQFCKQVHGMGNYVADTKFLYRVAMKFKNNSTATLDQIVNATNSSTDKYKHLYVPKSNEARANLTKSIDKYLTDQKITNNTQRAWAILGIAAHVVGDTFAHRSRVSIASVNEEYDKRFGPYEHYFNTTKNPNRTHPKKGASGYDAYVADLKVQLSDGRNHYRQSKGLDKSCVDCICTSPTACKFPNSTEKCKKPCGPCAQSSTHDHTKTHKNKNWCWCFTCFKTAVDNKCMEFMDIKLFQKDLKMSTSGTLSLASQYNLEDDINFYYSRYTVATKQGVNLMITKFNSNAEYTTHIYIPKDYNIKLNNLKSYILHTNTNWQTMAQSTRDLIEHVSDPYYK